jgi:hypothetical protein
VLDVRCSLPTTISLTLRLTGVRIYLTGIILDSGSLDGKNTNDNAARSLLALPAMDIKKIRMRSPPRKLPLGLDNGDGFLSSQYTAVLLLYIYLGNAVSHRTTKCIKVIRYNPKGLNYPM